MSELRRELNINGVTYHLAVNQYGSGKPGSRTPGKPGVLYMDTETGKLYKCISANPAAVNYVWSAHIDTDTGRVLTVDITGSGDEEITVLKSSLPEVYANEEISVGDHVLTTDNLLYTISEKLLAVGTGAGWKARLSRTFSSQNGNGLTTEQINALDRIFQAVVYDPAKDGSGAYAAFKTAFGISDSGGEEEPDEPVIPDEPDEPEKTLTSISAVYSGGDVEVGMAVNALTGIIVTAHYSDGTSEAVTGYTLSGTIAEGSNTITVSYGGKTTTFAVNGVAAQTGDVLIMRAGFIGNTSTATSEPEANATYSDAYSSDAFPVVTGDVITVNLTSGSTNVANTDLVRIRTYDSSGTHKAGSSNMNGAAYSVFTAIADGFARVMYMKTSVDTIASVVVTSADGEKTYNIKVV